MPADGRSGQLVTFRVGTEEFGVPIMDVYEIIFVPDITCIPRSPEAFIGVINLRGEIIPVIDMGIQFWGEKADTSRKRRIIVTSSHHRIVGLLVDEVTEVLRVEESNRVSAPGLMHTAQTAYMKAIYNMDSRIIVQLDLDQLLKHADLASIHHEIY
ncbi:chemotaxis protein CheW [Paenibacillus sambharensis]|uniref:chemotaxis protein CheW n=1 Tax=Paenibacillus sambharensis TaxID=1803190 RepID=UPI0015E8C826|nr:chemotaxis protein CheW [Paenibacillus sambharensis]